VLDNKRHSRTPDVPNAPNPRSENTSATDEYFAMLQEDVQEDYCGEEEIEVDHAMKAGGRDGEGVTCGQESRVRECSKEDLGLQEIKPLFIMNR
jgi:hypothetical protein